MDSSNHPSTPPPLSFPPPLPVPLFSSSFHPPKPRARRKPKFSGQPKATPTCTECGKSFSSWKALFGHMRCHPDREWRGINPPPHFPRAQFTDKEYQVATALVLLANGPPPETPSRELGSSHFSLPPSSSSFCCSQEDCLLDLNMPPPLESAEDGISPVLELKLGI